jgi:hypothetical protein
MTGLTGLPDTDGDGVVDALEEFRFGPSVSGRTNGWLRDSDADGLSDAQELGLDFLHDPATETDPLDRDTDGDGWVDGLEQLFPWFFPAGPLAPDNGIADIDADGLPDLLDPGDGPDWDLDLAGDLRETLAGTNPILPGDFPPDGDVHFDPGLTLRDQRALRFWLEGGPPPSAPWQADPTFDGLIDAADVDWIRTAQFQRWEPAAPLLPASDEGLATLQWIRLSGAGGGTERLALALLPDADGLFRLDLVDVGLEATRGEFFTSTLVTTAPPAGTIAQTHATNQARIIFQAAKLDSGLLAPGVLATFLVDAGVFAPSVAATLGPASLPAAAIMGLGPLPDISAPAAGQWSLEDLAEPRRLRLTLAGGSAPDPGEVWLVFDPGSGGPAPGAALPGGAAQPAPGRLRVASSDQGVEIPWSVGPTGLTVTVLPVVGDDRSGAFQFPPPLDLAPDTATAEDARDAILTDSSTAATDRNGDEVTDTADIVWP